MAANNYEPQILNPVCILKSEIEKEHSVRASVSVLDCKSQKEENRC